MIKIKVIGRFGVNNYEVSLNNYSHANNFLKAISVIDKDNTYAPANVSIKINHNVVGELYRIDDNSYCINVKNGESADLCQDKYADYEPSKGEDGAKFTIVTEPYIESVETLMFGNVYHIFVNVQSNKTKNIYRVLFDGLHYL